MSEPLTIELQSDTTAFAPGQRLAGTASWSLPERPRSVELRLFWYTQGKGTQDVGVVETRGFDDAAAVGREAFDLTLPAGPYSFSGRLISLIWALELVAEPGNHVARVEITLGPDGQEVVLATGEGPPSSSSPLDQVQLPAGIKRFLTRLAARQRR